MTAFSRLGVAAAFAALLSLPLFSFSLFAQDEKKEEPTKTTPAPLKVPDEKGEKPAAEKPAAEKPAAETGEKPAEEAPEEKPVDPQVEWKRLADRKIEIFDTLQGLKKKFEAAKDNDAKRTVRNEYTDLIREFETDIYPQMLELADAVWARDPTALDAGEIAMKSAFNSNKFVEARDISAKLLAAERRTRDVYRMGGMAEFALHNFENAAGLLEELVKVHKPRDPREAEYLENYVAEARKYIPFWEKEQAIRAKEAALKGAAALPRVEFEVSDRGKIVIELFEDHAPNTVASFIQTVETQKYNGVKFHRVIPAFMAQTGDTTTADDDPLNDGQGGGFTIPCECYREDTRMHFQGSLSMAHRGKDTGGTQFFMTHLPTYWLNHEKDKEESNHTCFGRVVEGMDILWSIERNDEIVAAKVLNKRDHEYKADRVSEGDETPDGTLDPKKTTEGDKKTTPEKTSPEKTTEKKPAEGDSKEADKTEPEKKVTKE